MILSRRFTLFNLTESLKARRSFSGSLQSEDLLDEKKHRKRRRPVGGARGIVVDCQKVQVEMLYGSEKMNDIKDRRTACSGRREGRTEELTLAKVTDQYA